MSEIIVGIDDPAGARHAPAFAAHVAAARERRRDSRRRSRTAMCAAGLERGRPRVLRADAQALRDHAAPPTPTSPAPWRSPTRRRHTRCTTSPTGSPPRSWSSGRRITVPAGRVVPSRTGERCCTARRAPWRSPARLMPTRERSAPLASAMREAVVRGAPHTACGRESPAALAAACQVARRFARRAARYLCRRRGRIGAPAVMTIPDHVGVRDDYEAMTGNAWTRLSRRCLPVSAQPVFVTGTAGHELAAQS